MRVGGDSDHKILYPIIVYKQGQNEGIIRHLSLKVYHRFSLKELLKYVLEKKEQ